MSEKKTQQPVADWGKQSDIKTFRLAMVCINCKHCRYSTHCYKDLCVRKDYIQIEGGCVCDDFEWREDEEIQ